MRPNAYIIYGFQHNDGIRDYCDRADAWVKLVCAAASMSHASWADQRPAIAAAPQSLRLGEQHAFGFVLARGDWDAPTDVPPLVVPPGMDARIAELCSHFGIDVQPCRWLMFSTLR